MSNASSGVANVVQSDAITATTSYTVRQINEYIAEIVSDSGEDVQKAGQAFNAISAKMGNSVWTAVATMTQKLAP